MLLVVCLTLRGGAPGGWSLCSFSCGEATGVDTGHHQPGSPRFSSIITFPFPLNGIKTCSSEQDDKVRGAV